MAAFHVYLHDIGDNTGLRKRLLEEHMAHIGRYLDSIRLAGPLLREGGLEPGGGMLIVDAVDAAEVRRMIEADPYFCAGLWDEVRIHPFKEIVNAWRR